MTTKGKYHLKTRFIYWIISSPFCFMIGVLLHTLAQYLADNSNIELPYPFWMFGLIGIGASLFIFVFSDNDSLDIK